MEEMKFIVEREGIDVEKLRRNVVKGYIVIFCNVCYDWVKLVVVGVGVRVKVNVNIGILRDIVDVKVEIEKVKVVVKYGVDMIMDFFIGGDFDEIRKIIMYVVDVLVGMVFIY